MASPNQVFRYTLGLRDGVTIGLTKANIVKLKKAKKRRVYRCPNCKHEGEITDFIKEG